MQRIDITSADAGKSRTKPKVIACALVTADDPFLGERWPGNVFFLENSTASLQLETNC